MRVRLLCLCLLLCPWMMVQGRPALVWGAMALRHYAVSATQANTSVTLSLPAKALLIDNTGTNDVFVNVSGSGVAVASGEQNMRVRAGTAVTLTAGGGEEFTKVGVICATGETATVYLTGTLAP